ncbi:glycosyltransferase family 4 protein [Pleurocapsales cyanobacterium LEGE 06147]|nr:glycosyltransferase family 4 protein [Pleurocapsales cyanobacterium LEGE 06147]
MRYHIPLKKLIDLESISRETQIHQRPRFDIEMLRQRLGATFKMPESYPVSSLDKLRSKIAGDPKSWSFASVLASQLGRDDLIFCTGEDIGIPVATLCGAKQDRPKIAVFFHNIDRPRGRVALKLFHLAERIDLFIVNSRPQLNFLRRYLNLPDSRVLFFWHPIDCNFFSPGSPSPNKTRPVIASVGLEKRDYRLLAAATENLDVDVKISGFSSFTSVIKQAFPKKIPANMSRRFYKWSELVQLYRDADVVAISVRKNIYAAGATALLEAMACRRPIVAIRTEGLADYLSDAIITVEPGDNLGLQEAILHLLNNPKEAEARAQKAYQLVLKRHKIEQYVEKLAQSLESL